MNFQSVKKIIFFIFKLALALGIVWYLLFRDTGLLLEGLRDFDVRYLGLAALFYAAHLAVCAWRWQRLADILGITLGKFESFNLTMQGVFFSLVIPGGAVGGDVVKMAVLTKRTPNGRRMEGAFTVLMDRIIGMIALFALVLVIIPFAWQLLMNCSVPNIVLSGGTKKLLILLAALLSVAGLAASCVIFMHKIIHKVKFFDRILKFADRISNGMVSRMEQAADVYSKEKFELVFLTAASVAGVHLLAVLPMMFLLSGLGVEYDIFPVAVAVVLGNVAGLIPIFPSGLGGRDLVTVTVLVAGGIAHGDAKAAQLLCTALIIIFNLCGGLFFIFDSGRKCAAVPQE